MEDEWNIQAMTAHEAQRYQNTQKPGQRTGDVPWILARLV
jgi:hypothetical protein